MLVCEELLILQNIYNKYYKPNNLLINNLKLLLKHDSLVHHLVEPFLPQSEQW
jgi:hypothetical protein